jgi:hypothetical protein
LRSGSEQPVRVFVGADRSQALAVRVLEHSIKRHTELAVEVHPMIDLPIRAPKDPLNGQRTGFSFSRFCIPQLAGRRGRALYMDADMLVFRDIRELWEIPFDGAKVVIQKEVKFQEETTGKPGAPAVRRKQCAVMLLDCARLDWDIERIIDGLDQGRYDYDRLMYELCILAEEDVGYRIPFEWNSLEHYDADTRLLHYTDVYTQPWTSCKNRNGALWFAEVRLMLQDGTLSLRELEEEIRLGYFRPSLLRDIRGSRWLPRFLAPVMRWLNEADDARRGYQPHREVYKAKQRREALLRARAGSRPPTA